MASWVHRIKAASELRRAQRALGEGDLERAQAHAERSARLRPEWLPASLWHGLTLAERGRLDEAEAAFGDAGERHPGAAVVRLFHGRILIDHQRYDAAREVLEEGARLAPSNLHLPGYLALADWAAYRDQEALEGIERLWSQAGGELWGRWLLALEEAFPGGPGTDYPADPERPSRLTGRFVAWRARRLKRRASKLVERGRYDGAAELLNRVERLSPGGEEALELRITLHRRAAEHRQEGLEADPYDVDARLAAADDLLEIGLARQAREILEPAAEAIEKLDAHRLSWLAEQALLRGRCALELGEAPEAVDAFTTARDLWPVEVEPHYFLGVAALKAGQRRSARDAWITACELDPDLLELRLRELVAATGGASPPRA